jgi:hypothetical protein
MKNLLKKICNVLHIKLKGDFAKPVLVDEKPKCVMCNKREPENYNTVLCWNCDVRRLIN